MKASPLLKGFGNALAFCLLFALPGCREEVLLPDPIPEGETPNSAAAGTFHEAYATPNTGQGNVRGFVFKSQLNRPTEYGPPYLHLSEWGWIIRVFNLDLPIVRHQYDFPLYAGASTAELGSGTMVGTVHFSVIDPGDDSYTVLLEYVTMPGWTLYEVNLYVDPLPPPEGTALEWSYAGILESPVQTYQTTFKRNILPEGHVYLIARAVVRREGTS